MQKTHILNNDIILESAYFLSMEAEVITFCYGSLFSSERVTGIGSEIAAMPVLPMIWVFYGAIASTLACGIFFYFKGKGGYLYSALSLVMFIIALVSIVSFIALCIYELPTHHCPICIIMEEYGYLSYLLYIILFAAVVSGIDIGALMHFRQVESLKSMLSGFIRKLTLTYVILYAAFSMLVTYEIVSSSLVIAYEVVY